MAITGIGSGLDISSIVTALVNAEAAPKTAQLNRLEKASTTKFTGLASFGSALSTFQAVLDKLSSPDVYEKRTATSGNALKFSVTADSKSSSGSYDVQVFNLAQTSKVALRGQDNASDPVGTGAMTITAGDTTLNIDVTDANSSLSGIRDAINAAGEAEGISATIVTDPGGAGGSRLVISSGKAGTGNDIAVSVATEAGDTGNLADLSFAPPATTDFAPTAADPLNPREPRVISYARDANLAIDGLAISSSSNTISDAVDGVSITLKAAQSQEEIDAGTSISLNVAQDKAGVKSSLQSFVDGYNAMMKTIGSLTSVTPVGGDDGEPLAAALVGDASVRSFMSAVRGVMGTAGSGNIRVLSELGITTQRDGTLALDSDKLDSALANNFDDLSEFLAGDEGIMSRLEAKIEPYTKSGGLLEGRTKSLQNTISGIDDQREALTLRIGKMEARLLAQFNAMDTLVAGLSSTSDYLTGQLANLPGVVKKDS